MAADKKLVDMIKAMSLNELIAVRDIVYKNLDVDKIYGCVVTDCVYDAITNEIFTRAIYPLMNQAEKEINERKTNNGNKLLCET